MKVEKFVKTIGLDFYAGVPDSQLKPLCNYLINEYGIDKEHHIIAANEGNCVAIAAGYHLATGRIPVVYMQNSGEGNIINPVASLLNDNVYAIPMVFIIGWRGEPGVKDEPQHVYQGKVTLKLLEDMDIESFVLGKDTTESEFEKVMAKFKDILEMGRSVAIVVKKDSITYDEIVEYKNENILGREDIIRQIVRVTGEDPIISTTGKASRELFEIRVENGQSNKYDFLTVGSMGHASSIALGVAFNKPNLKIWCIDGDGSALMHMGAMAIIGSNAPQNLIHIVINNSAHETVGGMPTVAGKIDLVAIARGCGYPYAVSVKDSQMLEKELEIAKEKQELCFIEVKSSIGARANLGRPTSSAMDNKNKFMEYLRN